MTATGREREWAHTPLRDRPRHWDPPKLTPQQRDDIRRRLADGEDIAALAGEYHVTAATIRHHR